jgi:hypothetical protein
MAASESNARANADPRGFSRIALRHPAPSRQASTAPNPLGQLRITAAPFHHS